MPVDEWERDGSEDDLEHGEENNCDQDGGLLPWRDGKWDAAANGKAAVVWLLGHAVAVAVLA